LFGLLLLLLLLLLVLGSTISAGSENFIRYFKD
jgi:hypothetical protein